MPNGPTLEDFSTWDLISVETKNKETQIYILLIVGAPTNFFKI